MGPMRAIARSMALTVDELFASPDHYLHSFEGQAAVFVSMNRAAYHRSIFLDARISSAIETSTKWPVIALVDRTPPPAPMGWIFHVAHCGSTLLARAIDHQATNLILREPFALRQLALAPDAQRLATLMAMLSKRYREDLPTIVKANVPVNFMLADLAAFNPQARAIILYLDLADYLIAVLRSEPNREWVRRITTLLSVHLGDLSGLSEAERAASLWLAQMQGFAAALGRMPNARTLDGDTFLADPRRWLRRAADHLGVPMTEDNLESVVGGPLFAAYSKNPRVPFNNAMRLARRSEFARKLAPELERAQHWIEKKSDAGLIQKIAVATL